MRSTAQKVSAIQSRLKRECEEIRANRNLTDSARRRQLAVATVRARREAADNVIEALVRDELDYAQGSQQADPNSVYIEQLEAS